MFKSKATIVVSRIIGLIEMMVGLLGFLLMVNLTIETMNGRIEIDPTIILLPIIYVVSIWLFLCGKRRWTLIRQFKKCVAILPNLPNGYIPDIAAALGMPVDKARKMIKRMIKKKYFVNAVIDTGGDCLVLGNRPNTPSAPQPAQTGANVNVNAPAQPTPASRQNTDLVTVKCKACGGINMIPRGKVGVCDYCGSAISAE